LLPLIPTFSPQRRKPPKGGEKEPTEFASPMKHTNKNQSIDALFRPRNVVLVGASDRPIIGPGAYGTICVVSTIRVACFR